MFRDTPTDWKSLLALRFRPTLMRSGISRLLSWEG